ncbi:MAG: hypothetical protein AAFZ02_10610 [Pseudomonadota bacterium]
MAGSAQAGVAAYAQCTGPDYEARFAAKFAERFPTTTCDGACDPWLMKSVEGLVQAQCRSEALADCQSRKCAMGLTEAWTAEADALTAANRAGVAALDLSTLPPLKAARLLNEDAWRTARTRCVGEEAFCDAAGTGHRLGDMQRIAAELEALP